ncbi:MAG: hypothetical protein EAX86_01485 [Candidatus Heimdallarchaeota archaeon]|nr:hypothetical protein [Candidatus Heimdallarchaeota archaeon]
MFRQLTEARTYSYINARIKARRSRLLTASDYEKLLLGTINEGLSYLGNFPLYAHLREKLSPTEANFSVLFENQIKSDFFEEISLLKTKIPEETTAFINDYLRKYFIFSLKVILRNIDMKKLEPLPIEEIFVASAEEKSELINLSGTIRIDETINMLSVPWIRNALVNALPEYQNKKNILILEDTLDKAFYKHLWEKSLLKLKGADYRIGKKLIGTEIDLFNLNIVLRGVVLKLSQSEILNQLIPISFRLGSIEDLMETTNTLQDVLEYLNSTVYSDLANFVYKNYLDINSIEILDQKKQESFIRTLFEITAGYPFHIGIFLVYMVLRIQEIDNLRIIFGAKAKDIDLDFARSLLIYFK